MADISRRGLPHPTKMPSLKLRKKYIYIFSIPNYFPSRIISIYLGVVCMVFKSETESVVLPTATNTARFQGNFETNMIEDGF